MFYSEQISVIVFIFVFLCSKQASKEANTSTCREYWIWMNLKKGYFSNPYQRLRQKRGNTARAIKFNISLLKVKEKDVLGQFIKPSPGCTAVGKIAYVSETVGWVSFCT